MKDCYICGVVLDDWQIENHHIIPRSMNGSDRESNLVCLCGSCHNLVYVSGCESGTHSKQGEKFLIIEGWAYSSVGRLLHWFDESGEHYE